jgi:DNA-binding CsgD family transcriptional regulator
METNYKIQLSKTMWVKVNEFLLSVSSSDSIDALNNKILKEIPAVIPFENSGILIEMGKSSKPVIQESVNLGKKWNDSFNNYYYNISTQPEFDKNTFSINYHSMEKHNKCEYYNDFILPQDINHSAGFIIFAQENPIYTFVLNRTRSERMYSKEELSVIKIIQPHVSNYYRMQSLFERIKKLPVLKSELDTDNGLLSPRESEVTYLLLQRTKPADIAKELRISILTVRKHIQNIYEKLNVMDRKQLFQKIHLDFKKND